MDVSLEAELPDVPAECRIDRTLFEQVITNLVMNALTHAGPELRRIDVALSSEGTSHVIEVSDDGRGLSVEDFDSALARFSQVSQAPGTGLGLPIAQAIVEAASGTLSLRPRTTGLTVCLTLPKARGVTSTAT